MDLYYAAAESIVTGKEGEKAKKVFEQSAKPIPNLLISMANGMKKIPKVVDQFPEYRLLGDSGAFTYHKKGGIKLGKWIKEAIKIKPYVTELIGLDVIGNAEKTYGNYLEIIKEIPDVIPTFHVGSPIEYLYKYLENTDRIAIGGMVPYKSELEKLCSLLNPIFKEFQPDALPRLHAFGYFSQQILELYPFYSADASTWQNYCRWGEFHKFERGQYLRMKSLRVDALDISSTSIKDLVTYIKDDPEDRLKRIKEAIDEFEDYLTKLWKNRGVIWNTEAPTKKSELVKLNELRSQLKSET